MISGWHTHKNHILFKYLYSQMLIRYSVWISTLQKCAFPPTSTKAIFIFIQFFCNEFKKLSAIGQNGGFPMVAIKTLNLHLEKSTKILLWKLPDALSWCFKVFKNFICSSKDIYFLAPKCFSENNTQFHS